MGTRGEEARGVNKKTGLEGREGGRGEGTGGARQEERGRRGGLGKKKEAEEGVRIVYLT